MMQEEVCSPLDNGASPATLPSKKQFFSKKGAYTQVKETEIIEKDGADEVMTVVREEFEVELMEDTKSVRGRVRSVWRKHQVIIAWSLGFCGLLCCAWIGPCFKYLGNHGVTATRRASWRSQALVLLLLLPTYLEYRTLTPAQRKDLFSLSALKGILVCGVMWLGDLSLWSNSLEFTTVPRASIFANSHSLVMVLYFKIRRRPISGLEAVGAVIGFSGLLTAVLGTQYFGGETATTVQTGSKLWLGDLLAFGGALSTLGYILNAGPTRKLMPVFAYTITNTIFLAIFLSIISIATEHTTFDMSVHGLFGWMQPQYIVVIGTLSVVAGVIGFNLNSFSVKFVPPVAYAIIGLCDPVVSGTYAWIVGVDTVPGVFTFIGGAVTIGGTVILLIGQERRTKKEKLMQDNSPHSPQQQQQQQHTHVKEGGYTLAVSEDSSAFSIGDEGESSSVEDVVVGVSAGVRDKGEEKRGLISSELDET